MAEQVLPHTDVSRNRFVTTRLDDPPRSVVADRSGRWVATFTDGARTVTLAGPPRRFAETVTTPATVETTTWVRLLRAPFDGTVDLPWLVVTLADRSPDLFALALQYTKGAPPIVDSDGLQIAGEAAYGPLGDDGRQERSDFNDYLGVTWRYPDRVDRPEAAEFRCLDCSGYLRMVWGYRGGVPLTWTPDGVGLPRRAVMMAESGPGVLVIADSGRRTREYGRLAPGDLAFFDVSDNDGRHIDHVGMYLGRTPQGTTGSSPAARGPTAPPWATRGEVDPRRRGSVRQGLPGRPPPLTVHT